MNIGPEGGQFVAAVVGDHSCLAGLPAGGAHLAVLVRVLEGLHEAEHLVDVAANGQVVDRELAEDALAIDDVGGTEGDTLIVRVVEKASVVAGDALGKIRDHGEVHGTETALVSGLHRVLAVGELRVDGAANELAADGLEVGSAVAELADLSGAHEGEVKWPEEEDNILACEKVTSKM